VIKNNNPGNIRRVQGSPWQGEIVPQPWAAGFVVFDSLEHGYRALLLLLNSYIAKGFDTIKKIITRWAPPSENNAAAYIQFVSNYTGTPATFPVPPDSETTWQIAAAISEMEHAGTITGTDLAALNAAADKLQGITPPYPTTWPSFAGGPGIRPGRIVGTIPFRKRWPLNGGVFHNGRL